MYYNIHDSLNWFLVRKSRISTGTCTRILSTYIVFEFVQLCSKDLHWKVKSSVQHSVDRYYVYVYYVYSVNQKLWFLCVKTIKPMSTVLAKSWVWLNGTETPLQEEADIWWSSLNTEPNPRPLTSFCCSGNFMLSKIRNTIWNKSFHQWLAKVSPYVFMISNITVRPL